MSKTPLYDLALVEFSKQLHPLLLWQGLVKQVEEENHALKVQVATLQVATLQVATCKVAARTEPCQYVLPEVQAAALAKLTEPGEPLPETMTISWERLGNCLWHIDCKVNPFKSGIVQVLSHEESSSTMKCLHCGQIGAYPKGGVGPRCVPVISTEPVKGKS